jgi:glycosyltransferase involved in cell wall biosynthesis
MTAACIPCVYGAQRLTRALAVYKRARMRPVLSVVAALRDEEGAVIPFLEELCAVLDGAGLTYEVICVDDGSIDGTTARLREIARGRKQLRPFALETHTGQSGALWAGIGVAEGEFIVLMDADLQNDPRDIPGMLAELQRNPGGDCILGVRVRRQDPWGRRVSSRIANRVAGLITGMTFEDAGCGIKLCRAAVLKSLPFFDGGHRFVGALVAMRGGAVMQKAVNHRPRRLGRSKYGNGLGRTMIALRDALGVRWLVDRNIRSGCRPIV